jgi:hypothetical protein
MTVTSLGLLPSSAGVRVCFPCVPGEIMSQLNHAYQGRQQPKLLDQVRYAIRAKHYSLRTEGPTCSGFDDLFCFIINVIQGTWVLKRFGNSCLI